VREVLGADPDPWQVEALTQYGTRFVAPQYDSNGVRINRPQRKISIRSGHGVGKTALLAWCIVHHLTCTYPQKTVCTAPTQSQLFDALASETKSWLGKLPPELQALFEVFSDRIVLRASPENSFVSFRTSSADRPEALAGVHSANVLLIPDEASGIVDKIFETAAGSMSGEDATTIMAGNPTRISGLFHKSHTELRHIWHTIHVNCENSPRVAKEWVQEMADTYGVDSNEYRVRVLGEFPKADDDKAIPFEYIESALTRDVKPTFVRPIWGLDVGITGDPSALCKRRGNCLVEKTKIWQLPDTMNTVGLVKAEWDDTEQRDRPSEILVDVIGFGKGVCDRLRELGLPARGINVAESPPIKGRHERLRDELWLGKGRQWFANLDCNIAGDKELADELSAQKMHPPSSTGKSKVYSKKEMKKLGKKSPNRADAFLLTLAGEAVTALTNQTPGSTQYPANAPLKREIKGIN
jgi:phage terminase large subunit